MSEKLSTISIFGVNQTKSSSLEYIQNKSHCEEYLLNVLDIH